MSENLKRKKGIGEFPDVYALLFILCIAAMVLTWVIPAGAFDRVKEGNLNKVVADSFRFIEPVRQTPWDVLQCIFQGFLNSSRIIFMIFFCGAAVSMVEETKSLSTIFGIIARRLRGKEMIAIALIMYALALGNTAGAFGNIGVALMPIGLVMAHAIGGDDFLGFLIIYFGLMSGFSIGFANPGILGVAQTFAEVPIFSGMPPRLIACLANITFLYFVTLSYYRTIKRDPTKSLKYEYGLSTDQFMGNKETNENSAVPLTLTKRQIIIILFFFAAVISCVALTITLKWAPLQIGSWFLGIAVAVGIISGFSMNDIAAKFIKGCKPMVYASFVTGIATAISLILSQGRVMDTIVYALSLPLNKAGAVIGAGLMVAVNALINIMIPSGSGQAAVVMPIMVPIADIVGITRQVAVQAFQFGDGLTNLATPINGPMMGCLAIAGVGFPRYIKWAIKYILIELVVAIVITMLLQAVGYRGY
ncbi:YfcC family protein [Treponema socranskii]|uniref:YfcC family protein n=1 Tax=Treponema socranskii TaxID=53419 RepID=UPI003D8D82C8